MTIPFSRVLFWVSCFLSVVFCLLFLAYPIWMLNEAKLGRDAIQQIGRNGRSRLELDRDGPAQARLFLFLFFRLIIQHPTHLDLKRIFFFSRGKKKMQGQFNNTQDSNECQHNNNTHVSITTVKVFFLFSNEIFFVSFDCVV